ncbi:alpha-amylase family glycosyl hydrolase [Winogradskyella vincentii]|uniref:Alpha-amylase n=1 Tax=Winogradskyella vincentii TaxID=2877122 RepID=A0ABS7XXG6_9FLAO|nr:alpha-amylase family glycosyl hydrolase [Winogradskyella vincentii]MCA0151710.1 hypothetical protein [Winogradskyella vincentii]
MRNLVFIFCLVLVGCSKSDSNSNNSSDQNDNTFEDTGISIYADDDPTNDVLMQVFWWDSFNDLKISNYDSYYHYINSLVVELSNANIDLLWFPPVSEGEGMGYHPRKLYDFNSLHGTEAQLESLLFNLNAREMHAMADLVFNHRIGTATWTDFTEPSWSCESICIDDEGFTNPDAFGTTPCGEEDEGWSWGGARDLNHQSEEVQEGLKTYLTHLKNLGFDSWRYDYVKGFPAKYVGEYNAFTSYYYSVGEFWDGNVNLIKAWVDQTGTTISGQTTNKAGAFDFALKYKLHDAFVDKNYNILNQDHSLANIPGYGSKSVTFLDNHDTGCVNRDDCDNLYSTDINNILKGYTYLLTHPGIPMVWIYHYLYSDPAGTLKNDINDLIEIRKENGINANSVVDIIETIDGNSGYYLAQIDNKILVKIGEGSFQPDNDWELIKSRPGINIWKK